MQTLLAKDKYAIVYDEARGYLSLQFPSGSMSIINFSLSDLVTHIHVFDDGGSVTTYSLKNKDSKGWYRLTLCIIKKEEDENYYHSNIICGDCTFILPEFFTDRLCMLFNGLIRTEHQVADIHLNIQ